MAGEPIGVSPDGKVVFVRTITPDLVQHFCRWTEQDGCKPLPEAPGGNVLSTSGCNPDYAKAYNGGLPAFSRSDRACATRNGSLVVDGESPSRDSDDALTVLRWSQDLGWESQAGTLGDLTASGDVLFTHVSAADGVLDHFYWPAGAEPQLMIMPEGSTSCDLLLAELPPYVRGLCRFSDDDLIGQPMRWTAPDIVEAWPGLPPVPRIGTPDGTVVAGSNEAGTQGGFWRWSESAGATKVFESEFAATGSEFLGISSSGEAIFGVASSPAGDGYWFRWSEATGGQRLLSPPESDYVFIERASAHGSLVAGEVWVEAEKTAAAIWRGAEVLVVAAELERAGADLQGVFLDHIRFVDAGPPNLLVGIGTRESSQVVWRARLPVP